MLAAVYRSLGDLAPRDPIDFMMAAISGLAALQWAALFACASFVGGSPLVGGAALLFAGAVADEVTRVTRSPTLRENMAIPWLWMQMVAETLWLQTIGAHHPQPPGALFVASTTLFVVSWQFAPFVLLLQVLALLLMCVHKILCTVADLFRVALEAAGNLSRTLTTELTFDCPSLGPLPPPLLFAHPRVSRVPRHLPLLWSRPGTSSAI